MNRCSQSIVLLATAVVCLACVSPGHAAAVPSAKEALALANQKVDAAVQDKIIRLVGSNSDSNLRPRLWSITMYDTTRVNDGVLVRVKDGAVNTVSSSMRMFDDGRWKNFSRNFSGYWPAEVIDVGRWGIDSDQIVNTARSHPKLAGYEVTEVTMVLRKLSDGSVPPSWRLRLRARPSDNPSRERWVGYLQYNAETGELLSDELTVGR